LEKEKYLDCERASDIIKQIAYGVDHAHKNKINSPGSSAFQYFDFRRRDGENH
jgi:hypothetical protein